MILPTALGAISIAGQDASLMIAAQAPPAGCHQHAPAPAHHPVSYRCCQSGHDFAILQAPVILQPDSSQLAAVDHFIHIQLLTRTDHIPHTLSISSADLPGIIPLRV